MNSLNRRRAPRYTVKLSVTVLSLDQAGTPIAFTTKNISESGLLVQSQSNFTAEIGEQFELVLFLHKIDHQQNIRFKIEIVHQDKADHIHGMQICSIIDDEREKLQNLISQIADTLD